MRLRIRPPRLPRLEPLPAPDRCLPRTATAAAYALLLLIAGPTLLLAALYIGIETGWTVTRGMVRGAEWTVRGSFVVQAGWLVLTTLRHPPRGGPRAQAAAILFACTAVLALWSDSAWISCTSQSALTAALCLAVCRTYQIRLSTPAPPRAWRHRAYWRDTVDQTVTVVGLINICGAAAMLLTLVLRHTGPAWLPVMRTDQITALGASTPSQLLPALSWTVVLEGAVTCVVARILFESGRRPWLIYTTVGVTETAFHIYFGVAAPALGLYAVACCGYYLRLRRIGPLLAGHLLLDLVGLLLPTVLLRMAVLFPVILITDRLLREPRKNRPAAVPQQASRRPDPPTEPTTSGPATVTQTGADR